METIISAINNNPAGSGLGSVLLSGLTALGVMALIYGVLELMDHVNKKKGGGEEQQPPQYPVQRNNGSLFSRVLAQKMKQKNERDGSADDDKDMRA